MGQTSTTYQQKIAGAIHDLVFAPRSIYPLITFRILFGAMMVFGTARFMLNGWVDTLFVEPTHFFKFYGFEWIVVPDATLVYALHYIVLIAGLCIALGCFYRVATLVFLLTFTYIELMDATNYLNHYYLVVLLSAMLCVLPANAQFSVDARLFPHIKRTHVPAWCIHIIMVQLCIVYFFAGLAKVNTDWLFRAMPMAIWLPERADYPILGTLFEKGWIAFAFSWAGCLYDLTIWIFLLIKRTRAWAYLLVVGFHLMTWSLFNIGLFPLIMITSTLIFFSAQWHENIYQSIGRFSKSNPQVTAKTILPKPLVLTVLGVYIAFQILFPLRSHGYDGNVLWHEQGYRFSWRVMLVEKSGTAMFYIKNEDTGKQAEINISQYLTKFQEKQMIIQPDFILQFAKMVADDYQQKYQLKNISITADIHVALNKRMSQRFIKNDVNLLDIEDDFSPKEWVLPLQE